MPIKYRSIAGTKDILPPAVSLWRKIEAEARDLFCTFNYREIRTPVIEHTELFVRSVGKDTDIVEKEMYTFTDRDEKSVSLRPEATAGAIRAYLQNGLYAVQSLWKLYYIGPMFRRERPQQGRLRQFHQIGAELIGSYLPSADCETIIWVLEYFRRLGVGDTVLNINSAGCPKCKPDYIMRLREELKPNIGKMCLDCQRRYKKNIFRMLDCKQPGCRVIIDRLPVITDYLCSECSDHFNKLRQLLDTEGIDYKLNPHLVRGLDYYNRTVYEFNHRELGSQDAIAAGGRYDILVKHLMGPVTGAVGFSIGVERLIMVMEKVSKASVPTRGLDVYLISLDEESFQLNFTLINELRRNNISADIDYEQKSLKAQMRSANKQRAVLVILRGGDEIKKGVVTLKDMSTGEEQKVPVGDIEKKLKKILAAKHKQG